MYAYFQYFMENKKEISLEDFMASSWSRLKQLIFAQSVNVKETEHLTEEEHDKQVEEIDDQEENEDETETVDDEVKYTETEELDESQYDAETKLIVEGKNDKIFYKLKLFILIIIFFLLTIKNCNTFR